LARVLGVRFLLAASVSKPGLLPQHGRCEKKGWRRGLPCENYCGGGGGSYRRQREEVGDGRCQTEKSTCFTHTHTCSIHIRTLMGTLESQLQHENSLRIFISPYFFSTPSSPTRPIPTSLISHLTSQHHRCNFGEFVSFTFSATILLCGQRKRRGFRSLHPSPN
jgi:hypothetical protein